MKLATEKALLIAAGLRNLDGYDRVVKDGDRERVVRDFYKLGGGLRLSIAKNLNRLDEIQNAYQKSRSALMASMANDQGQITAERMPEFVREEREMLDAEQEVDLLPINQDELKLDQNPIPGTILSLISPLLRE